MIGLGVRGRLAVVGVERVREAAMKHKLVMAFVAPDASRHSLDKIVPLLDARRVRYVRGPGAAMLGQAVGRDTTAAVGIVDRQLAKGIRALVDLRRVE
jgi:ribosomal protein L7Ae-like RNA K-turn-binding protein